MRKVLAQVFARLCRGFDRRHAAAVAVVTILPILAAAPVAHAGPGECEPGWIVDDDNLNSARTRFSGYGGGFATVWDSDGDGPGTAELVVAFASKTTDATGQYAPIQAWDGEHWRSIGKPPQWWVVTALDLYQGDLVVFNNYGQPGFYRWNGQDWVAFAPGLNGFVTKFVEFDGAFWAAGSFQVSGESNSFPVARWNGNAWEFPDAALRGSAVDLLIYQDTLYTAGNLRINGEGGEQVLRWDEDAWTSVGHTNNINSIKDMVIFEDRLILTGVFNGFNGVTTGSTVAWDGQTWSAMGDTALYGEVLGVVGGKLYIGQASSLWMWNGTAWEIASLFRQFIGPRPLHSLVDYQGLLVLAGDSSQISHKVPTRHGSVIGWDGSSWVLFHEGYDNLLARSAAGVVHQGHMVMTGWLNLGTPLNTRITALWDGSKWRMLGSNLFAVHALLSFGDDLVAATSKTASVPSFESVLVWRDNAWQPIGFGTNPYVYALAEYEGDIIAGGNFLQIGISSNIQPIKSVARYDGTQWLPIGNTINGAVTTLAVYNGELYAAGKFTVDNADPAITDIARWDGSAWVDLGGGLNGSVKTLKVYDNQLVVGGSFYLGDSSLHRIAQWNGSIWSAVGDSSWLNGEPVTMDVHNGELVIGGKFAGMVSDGSAQNIARWNGTNWRTMNGNPNSDVTVVASDGDVLHVGGAFASISNGYGVALYSARWACEVPPCVADMDGSGGVDVADLMSYINAWLAKDAAADVNGDEAVDVADLFAFINAWLVKC